ncbi:MAG: efflux RND transporter periplasmic adaptor subunit [Chlorobi bacterium]|nr:efflux RND transporter periplasmic adaptor subunit [Chlorobiota bacterium]
MKQYSIFKLAFISVLTILFYSCSGNKDDNAQTEDAANAHLIKITQKQFDFSGMQLGKVSTHKFEKTVDCNGYINVTPDGLANISTQIGGLIKKINVSPGDRVKKGDILCELSSNDFINLQKDFAETSAKLNQLEADYKRSKKLYEEKIGSEKNFIAIESAYNAMKAQYTAYKMQLQMLGLNVDRIEKGNFYSACPVVSPITGLVSDVYVNLGQFAEQQQRLMEVIDQNKMQLRLSVFEDDIYYLKPGQTVRFHTVNNQDTLYTASLNKLSKSINPETKTITCLANITPGQKDFVNNSFIRAGIITDKQDAPALPNDALIKSETGIKVLSLVKKEGDTYYFKPVKVNTGRVSKKFTEILNGKDLDDVLIKGVYNLNVD